MPGILPMKVIRVGNSVQARIAQACDRCRSKKIRCDGIRPCCTQCANVGFECKTSDKLSRRAFPRGYTESLEDRVRGLEAEVRELKDLLDEKDEKIDMLSRLHNFSPPSRKCSTTLSSTSSEQVKQEIESAREDVLLVDVPSTLPPISAAGGSSTAAFIEAFDQKVHDNGHADADIRPGKFAQLSCPLIPPSSLQRTPSKMPPRLVSDQYINLFFQEWQPLLPVLHRPSFLRVYEDYLTNPEAGQWHSNKQAVAQLFLIFGISALSLARPQQTATACEAQWRKALQATTSATSLATLQCHVLAQLYYLLRADYPLLTRHRAIAVAMCHQLGLHQGHKYRGFAVLESETRKKVFWVQYVLDKFTSATTGSPMLLGDHDITTELPADIDDENIGPHGISPTLPGELTKLSSAIAFFKVARILSATLADLYPSGARYELSLEKLHALSEKLDQWSQSLPSHLRLQFKQDRPSTNVVSCRSPLLSLAYFYIRSLIHRPLVINGSGSSASSSTIVVAAAGKHVLQILDLLDERRMNYTFPVNKSEILLSCGFSLLWQCLDLEDDSKIFKDNQKSLNGLLTILMRDSPMVGLKLHQVASTYVTVSGLARPTVSSSSHMDANQAARHLNAMGAPQLKHKSTRKSIQAIASRFSPSGAKQKTDVAPRSKSIPVNGPGVSLSLHPRTLSSASLSSTRSAPVLPMSSPQSCQLQPYPRPLDFQPTINLDYFPIGNPNESSTPNIRARTPAKGQPSLTDTAWEELLTNVNQTVSTPQGDIQPWKPASDPDVWSIGELTAISAVPQSVTSFSEESLTSAEDLVFSRCASNNGSTKSASTAVDSLESSTLEEKRQDAFKGIAIPFDDDFDLHA